MRRNKIEIPCAGDEEKETLEPELRHHLNRAKEARERLKSATELTNKNAKVLVSIFDAQKNQPLPRLDTSVAFFKRKLWMFNIGIIDRRNNQGYMAMWTETEGRKGTKKIFLCLNAYLKSIDTSNIEHIKTFSDACGGQNRNKSRIRPFVPAE